MEESELRGLAEDLRDALPGLIDDEAERATVAADLDAALAAPPGSGRATLFAAMESEVATRPSSRRCRAGDHASRRSDRSARHPLRLPP